MSLAVDFPYIFPANDWYHIRKSTYMFSQLIHPISVPCIRKCFALHILCSLTSYAACADLNYLGNNPRHGDSMLEKMKLYLSSSVISQH